ncbi:MAG: hypothetical protein ACK50A_09410 [Sphingobacteriaceae bacterium]
MQIETNTATFSLSTDGILIVTFKNNDIEIDLEEAKAQVAAAEKLTNKQYVPVLIDARRSMHDLSKEAKKYIAEYSLKKAEAILVKELHQRIIASFYLKVSASHSNHPMKVFTDEAEAMKWLRSFK